MADAVKPKPKGKGGGLGRKLGPLPVWAWAAIAAGAGLLVYLKLRAGSSSTPGESAYGGTVQTVTGGSAADQAYGGYPTANAAPVDSLSPDVVAQLADYRGSLYDTVLSAFDEGNADLGNLLASYGGTQATPASGATIPPIEVHVTGAGIAKPAAKTATTKPKPTAKPAANKTATSAKPAAKPAAKVSAKQPAPATHYYTYKKDVKVGKGQQLRFRAGKGYYAA